MNLAYTGTVTNGTTGAIVVTNGIAWMEMNFSLSDTLNVEGGLILATYSIAGTTVASGPVAGTTSRALVWGNSAGTRQLEHQRCELECGDGDLEQLRAGRRDLHGHWG